MSFFNLKDVDFVDIDVKKLEHEATAELERRLGKEIYPASPERIMLLTLLDYIIQDRELINDTGKMNLLAYARGDFLDHIGAFFDETRFESHPAECTVRFTLSTELDFVNIIPPGTRVKTSDGRIFKTTEPTEIHPGNKTVDVVVTAEEPGSVGNGIRPGQLNILIDLFPYYQSVENITESGGGLEREQDDHYRDRVHEAPEKMSTAGPDGAYRYYAKKTNPNIGDVEVWSPEPGIAQVVPLYVDGSVPNKEVLDEVHKVVNDRRRRPLTDKVEVVAPTVKKFSVDVEFWITDNDKPFIDSISAKVKEAVNEYVKWQKGKLGRDINPDKLLAFMINAGAKRVEVKSPVFTSLKAIEVAHVDTVAVNYKGVEDE